MHLSNKEDLYPIHQISENYALQGDVRSFNLLEKYEKKDGKGRNANPTGEFGWKEIAYFNNVDSLNHYFKKYISKDAIAEVGLDIEKIKEYVDIRFEELRQYLNEHITITTGISTRGKKGVDDSDEE